MKIQFLMIMAVVVAGCSDSHDTLDTWKWERVTPASDSIIDRIEWQIYYDLPTDSIESQLDRLEKLIPAASGNVRDALCARLHFFRAAYFSICMNYAAEYEQLDSAFLTTDSIRRPYEFHRIKSSKLMNDELQGISRISEMLSIHDFFVRAKDGPMSASSAMNVGISFAESGQIEKAIEYYNVADSILHVYGLERTRSAFRINYATLLDYADRSEESSRVILESLGDTIIKKSKNYYNVILRNAFLKFGDVAYVKAAYEQIRDDSTYSDLRSLYDSFMTSYYLEEPHLDLDSARFYAGRLLPLYPNMRNVNFKSHAAETLSRLCRQTGDDAGAYAYLHEHTQLKDSAYNLRNPENTMKIQHKRELALADLSKRAEHRMLVIRFLAVLLIMSIGCCAGIFLYYRSRQKYIMEKANARLELERKQRQLMAASIAMEETDRMSHKILDVVNGMKCSGKIGDSEEKALSEAVREHSVRQGDIDNISTLVEKTHPEFIENLRASFPGLADTQLKLASYILVGMDNKQIATFLNIRPESVRQAKWRLRSRMNLGRDESLEDMLKALNRHL